MNEYLLKAIIRLFAIVVKGNVNDECRERIKFIVHRQADREQAAEYLKIFDDFAKEEAEAPTNTSQPANLDRYAPLRELRQRSPPELVSC